MPPEGQPPNSASFSSHEHNQQPIPITFEQIVEGARERLLADGSHPPLLVLDGETNTVNVDLDLPNTSARRQELMYVIGIRVARSGIVGGLRQVFLVSEAWMSTPADFRPAFRPPSKDPNRQEVLMIVSRRPENIHTRRVTIEILRESNGAVRDLRDVMPDASADTVVISPLLNAFIAGYTQGRASLM